MAFTPIVSSQTVTGETVSAGYQSIINGGITNSATLNTSGTQNVIFGGVANFTTINSGGIQFVASGGVVNSTTMNSGGQQHCFSGGVANYTNINYSSFQNVYSGGTANSTTISSGGMQGVWFGGIVNSTTINSGGMLIFFSGGNANVVNQQSGAIIQTDTRAIIAGGINARADGHSAFSIANGVASNFLLEKTGILSVLSGNSALNTLIASGGSQIVSSGGTACVINQQAGAVIITDTRATITSGINARTDGHSAFSIVSGIASNFLFENGGWMLVNYGNSAIDTLIASGGRQYVYGTNTRAVIKSGGTLMIGAGGSATGFNVSSGGILGWDFNAVFSGTSNGIAVVSSSGNNSYNLCLDYTDQVVSSGCMADSTTVNTSGYQYISSGGIANFTAINSSGYQVVFSGGAANSNTINFKGDQIISSGGIANYTTINSGGWQEVFSGGVANVVNQQSGGKISADTGATITGGINARADGHNAFSIVNGVASNFMLENWGELTVLSGNSAIDTVISSGGSQIISSGGVANSTTINISGWQVVSSGGVNFTNISGGVQTVYSGGRANSTNINFGYQYVFSGAVATLTDINSDGSQWVYGVANSTTVNSGGSQAVFSGGVTSNTIVNSGGSMYINSGGIVSGSLTIAGGHVTVEYSDNLQPAAMSFVLADAKTGDALLTINSGVVGDISHTAFTLDVNNTVTGDYVLGSGSNLTGMSSAVFTVTDGGQSVNVQVGSSYTFADGDKLSLDFTDAATDQLTAKFTERGDIADTLPPSAPGGLTETGIGKNVSFDWSDSIDAGSGVKNYLLEYATNDQFTGAVQSTVVVSNARASNLTDGIYYWRVKAADNAGNTSNWVNGDSFMVDATAPAVPSGLTMTRSGNNLTFDWNDASDATSGVKQYQIELDSSDKFSNLEYFKQVTDSQASVANLASGTHYWRVRAQDNSGNLSAWSAAESFTMELVPPTVPGGLKQTVTGSSVAFDWNDSTDASGIRQYEIRVDNNSDFSSPEYSKLVDASAASTSLALGTYYWQVRAQDKSGNYSAWSSSSKFVVTPTDTAGNTWQTANDIASPDNWVGYGDPADFYKLTMTNAGTLTLGLTGLTGNADLSLLSATGAVLKTSANAGPANESIVQSLLAGIYYVKVAAGASVNDASYTLNHTEKYCPTDTAANTWQSAGDISNLDNWVGFGDAADFYKLTMTNAGTLSLGLTGLTGNADLSLLSSTGTVLKNSSNTGTTPEAINNVALLAGTYYVKVAAGTSVNDASYTLSNTIKYCPTDKAANDYKTALDISNLDNWVGFGDTTDFYKLTMTNAGTLSLGLTGLAGNADLSLLSSTGTVLKSSSNTGTTSEAINNIALLAGTYYVKVAAGASVNDASYNLTNTIKYCPTDKAANDYKTALDISNLDNWVGFGDAADFYKLTMTNAGTLTLGLTGLTGNADLSLLSSTGTVLKSSSNTGTTPETINNVALLAGTYYVKVAAGTSVNDASYTLSNTIKYCTTDKAANDYKTALDISNLDNWVGFGDAADFYKLTMTNAGTLTLGLTGLTGNADLSLLSSTGMVLKSSSNTGTTSEAINNVALLAGTYYVKVAAGTSVTDASYTLSNTIKYCPTDTAANDYATAKDIKAGVDNWVGFGDSADFYKLTMTNAGTLSLDLTGLTGNVEMSLLSSTGTVLKSSANTGIANEAINSVSLLAGTYYVKVATGFGVNDAYYTLSDLEKYFPLDNAGSTQATAKLVDAPTQTGWVGFGDSDDYYRFDLANTAQETLRLHDMTGGNADLTLYDSKGTMLQKSANTGALEDTITRNLAAGTYYARVTAVSGNIDYKLDFSKKDIVSGMLAS